MHSLGLLNVPAVRMCKVSSILQSPLRGFANFSNLNNLRASASALRQNYSLHTDSEFQAIVQGLEVSSPSFRAILGVLFCDYDVSQGLRG